MKYTGPTFRPPIEADTLLLQVTVGCAHNHCTFCTMYQNTKFTIETINQIEADLREAQTKNPNIERIFLINGDAFVLSARRLKIIASKIRAFFPNIKTISMYAAIRNIKDKTDDQLKALEALGINDLYVGLETGHKDTLAYLNKGYSLDDAYEQLERLNKSCIRFNALFILGIAGKGNGLENAIATAKLINTTKPQLVGVTTIGLFPNSQLSKDAHEGLFKPATELEIFKEQKKLLELIDIEDLPFLGNHPLNIAGIKGTLPEDRQKMLDMIDYAIESYGIESLNQVIQRSSL